MEHASAAAIAFGIYLAFSIALTWPLALHLGDSLFGDFGDRRGHAWAIWADLHGLREGGTTQMLAAPFGRTFPAAIHQPLYEWPLLLLARWFGEIAAINIATIVAFALTAAATFVFLQRLLGESRAAFFGGLAFGFCPAAIFQSAGGHGEYALNAFVPLLVLALFNYRTSRTAGSASVVAVAFAGEALVSIYVAYFCVYLIAAFLVFDFLTTPREMWLRMLKNYAACAVLAALFFLPFHLPAVHALFEARGSVQRAFLSRDFGELFVFSARPIDYLLPAIDHPVFGRWSELVMRDHVRDNLFEQTLYLGVIPLSLISSLCFVALKSRRAKIATPGFVFFLVAGLWMFLVSLPPQLGEYPNISKLVYPIVPAFRVYARAGVIVELCVACAASVALAELLIGLPLRVRNGITALVLALLAFEFWSVPPGYALSLKTPRVYEWLATTPGNIIVAEYPMAAFDEAAFYNYPFWQRLHSKRLVNGASTVDRDAWAFYQRVKDLSNPDTPALLKAAGVDYVIVHKKMYSEGPIPYQLKRYYSAGHAGATFAPGSLPPMPDGFRLHVAFGDDLVFRLR